MGIDSTIDGASFEKNYTYDLEHTYGKKGHLQGSNAFGCPKLIGFPAEASGQFHGCPFKVVEGAALKQQMHKWGIPEPYVNEMHNLVSRGNHYQLACIEYSRLRTRGTLAMAWATTPATSSERVCGTIPRC